MEVTKELVHHVADTARITLTEEETISLVPELKEVLQTFSKLKEVNTDNIAPLLHPIELKNRVREDTLSHSLPVEIALKNAEHKKGNYFKGPSIN